MLPSTFVKAFNDWSDFVMMPKKMIKVICIIMAALMLLSVGAVVFQVLAVDGTAISVSAVPSTGENFTDVAIPAGIIVLAVVAVVVCVVLPKMKKKEEE